MYRLVYLKLALLILSYTECIAQNYCLSDRFSETAYFDSSEIRVDSNITYANPIHAFTQQIVDLKMDIYYPDLSIDSLALRPFILLIHGGAFLGGNRTEKSYECMEYARRGFVSATIDYRLGWNCSATDLLGICVLCQGGNADIMTATYCAAQDARAAMRHIFSNASTYRIDTSALFIGGESAGGITALHATFWDQSEANSFDPNALSRAGSLDTAGNSIPSSYSIKAVINSCGAISKDSALLNNGNIPIINFHDEFDCVVPTQYGQVISCICQPFYWTAGSSIIYSKLTANNICTQYYQVPLSVNHCSYSKPELISKASCFLKSLFCQSCQSGFVNQTGTVVSCSMWNAIEDLAADQTKDYYELKSIGQNQYVLRRTEFTGELEFVVTDLCGRLIHSGKLLQGMQETYFSTESLSSGMYCLQVKTNSFRHCTKIIKPDSR
ncbi:MAG TPA: alpha/beta hydrolase fold domain-containing protein [Bacteroidia bacterium]|nr:alpha/beta hydrolase fold domain-containing protein [Bacteroidia bacterium]HNP99429.1 alpha/beta hydrolase fold domain-containing protein [Bacteroidia bacterium]